MPTEGSGLYVHANYATRGHGGIHGSNGASGTGDRPGREHEHHVDDRVRRAGGANRALAGIGYSLLSAIAGVVDEPMKQLAQEKPTTTGVLGGLGRGVLGVITKPVGGAMELVASTSKNILDRTGLLTLPVPQHPPLPPHPSTDSALRIRRLVGVCGHETVLLLREAALLAHAATGIKGNGCTVLVTRAAIHIVDLVLDAVVLSEPLAAVATASLVEMSSITVNNSPLVERPRRGAGANGGADSGGGGGANEGTMMMEVRWLPLGEPGMPEKDALMVVLAAGTESFVYSLQQWIGTGF